MVNGLGSANGYLMTIGILAIKKAERILLKSCLAGIAEAIDVSAEIVNKRFSVRRSALLASDGVHVELNVFKTEAAKNGICQRNRRSIGSGAL